MNSSEIQIGKNYWVKPSENSLALRALVLRAAPTEPRSFRCISDDGEAFIVFAEAFIRPVEPEPVAS